MLIIDIFFKLIDLIIISNITFNLPRYSNWNVLMVAEMADYWADEDVVIEVVISFAAVGVAALGRFILNSRIPIGRIPAPHTQLFAVMPAL